MESGHFYYRNRIFSPILGRFLNPDPRCYFDSYNFFLYVRSNSSNLLDPTGEFTGFFIPQDFIEETLARDRAAREDMIDCVKIIKEMMLKEWRECYRKCRDGYENQHGIEHFCMEKCNKEQTENEKRAIADAWIHVKEQVAKDFENRKKQAEKEAEDELHIGIIVPFSTLPSISNTGIRFAQKGVSPKFGHGEFKGKTFDYVVSGLESGSIKPSQLPVIVVTRNGIKYAINNRSLMALRNTSCRNFRMHLKRAPCEPEHSDCTRPYEVVRVVDATTPSGDDSGDPEAKDTAA
jgi:hypothetical protein